MMRGSRADVALPNCGVHLLASRVELRAGVDAGPVHGVEQVVDLPADLHPPAAAHLEVLEHRQVGVPDPRQAEEPRRRRCRDPAGLTGARTPPSSGTSPCHPDSDPRLSPPRGSTPGQDDATAGAAAVEVEVVRRREAHAGPVARDERRVARELPAVERAAGQRVVPQRGCRPARPRCSSWSGCGAACRRSARARTSPGPPRRTGW